MALGLRSRYVHAPTIIPAKKPLLDLYGDFVQPLLGTICPVHLIPNVCLQCLNAAQRSRALRLHAPQLRG
jgi:hypothetical protein